MSCLNELPIRLAGGLSTGSIYALIAIGYTLVYGVLQLINFAHSEIFMAGSLAGLLTVRALTSLGLPGPVVLVIALVPGAIAAATVAAGVERVAYRPLRKRRAPRLAYLISAIGMSLVLANAVLVWRGRDPETFPPTLPVSLVIDRAGFIVSNRDVIILVVAIAMMIALDRFIAATRTGRGIRAVSQDPDAASLMGVNIDRVITTAFVIGGLLAGVAGVLFGYAFGRTRFDIGFLPGIKAFTAAVLGGIGNIRGALVGGLMLGLFENLAAGCFGTQWRDVVAFAILVVVLMFRPSGLLGAGK